MVASPVATCRPWVTRYSPTGRDGHQNQPGGCWMRWLSSPVTKQMVNAAASAMPSWLVSRGERNRESKVPDRSGPRRSAAGGAGHGWCSHVTPRVTNALALAAPGVGCGIQARVSVANHRSASVHVDRTPQFCGGGDPGQVVGGHRRPPERCAGCAVAVAQADLTCPGARAGCRHLDVQPAVGGEQVPAAAQQEARVAADADVAVGEQQVPPSAVPGQGGEHVAAQRGGAAGSGEPDGGGADVDAERGYAEPVQGAGEPPRSAADVQRRPGAAGEQRAVAGHRGVAPGGGVDAVVGAVLVAQGQRDG